MTTQPVHDKTNFNIYKRDKYTECIKQGKIFIFSVF